MGIKTRLAAIVAAGTLTLTATYTLSPSAEEKLVQFEGEKLVAYLDPPKVATIGIGSTKGVAIGDKITKEESRILLRDDLRESSKTIERLVTVPIHSQDQVDALLHWLHNFGSGNLQSSTLLVKINSNDCFGAAKQFLRWDKMKVWDKNQEKFVMVVSKHQQERRQWEHDKWLLGCTKDGKIQ